MNGENPVLRLGNLKWKANQLQAEDVILHKQENKEAHKTDEYEDELLILRRGQAFDVTVKFSRNYDPRNDIIILKFVTGKNPKQNKGGIVRVAIQDEPLIPSTWGMQVKKANGDNVRLSIMSSAQASIGYYDVIVETRSKDSSREESLHRHQQKEKICILFNAWCSADVVYMDNNKDPELDANEYVLKENGHIWRGSLRYFSVKPWNFGQFDSVVLKSALFLLDKAGLGSKAMSNVIHVTRTMTSMVNSVDLGGVLEGRWGDDFPEGTTLPWDWSGSVEILEIFWRTKQTVKYGQCWVFSGVLTSLLRALGIPTRSVTNIASARDTDKSLTIDYYFDADGKAKPNYNEDSVWNFHVWNESWFKRLDLPNDPVTHDGWQAIDGTPQETSGGVYQCGPASVNAIKNGEVYLSYDTDFIFAEVNADQVYWEVGEGGELKAIEIDKQSTGKYISTRKPGTSTERSDLTNNYKHPEGSVKEREVVEFANRFSTKAHLQIYGPAVRDVTVNLEVAKEVQIGKAVKATGTVKNESSEERKVTAHFTAILIRYTGQAAKQLKDGKITLILKPHEGKSATFDISTHELLGKVPIADDSIKLFLTGSVNETNQRFAIQDIIEFAKPRLKVTVSSGSVKLNERVTVTLSITNMLSIDLTKGKFHLEFNHMKPKTMVFDCKIPANKEYKETAIFLPRPLPNGRSTGFRNLSVTFSSSEVSGLVGEAYVYVEA